MVVKSSAGKPSSTAGLAKPSFGLVWPLEEIGLESWTLAGAPPQSSSSLVVCSFSLLSGGVAQFSLTDLKGMPSTPRDEASMAQMHEVAFRCVAICHCKHRIRVLYTYIYIYIYYATLLGVGFLSYS